MNIGENIKKIRELKNISQEKLSELSGIPRTSLGRYERGERMPNIDVLNKIANALEVDMDILLYGTDIYVYTREDVFELFDKLYTNSNIKQFVNHIGCFDSDNNDILIEGFLEGSCTSVFPYNKLGEYLLLSDNEIYNWILTDNYFNNSDPEDWDSLGALTKSDFKYIIENNMLEKEDINNLVKHGICKKNYDILIKYCKENGLSVAKSLLKPEEHIKNNKINIPGGFTTKPNIISPGLAYESLVNLILYINQKDTIELLDDSKYRTLLSKVTDLLEFELFKIRKENEYSKNKK